MEEDGYMVCRYMLGRQRECSPNELFDEVEVMFEELCRLRVESFGMYLRCEDEGSVIFIKVDPGILREEAPALTSFQVGIDAGEHSVSEAKRSRRFIAVTEHNDSAEQS